MGNPMILSYSKFRGSHAVGKDQYVDGYHLDAYRPLLVDLLCVSPKHEAITRILADSIYRTGGRLLTLLIGSKMLQSGKWKPLDLLA